MGDITACTSVIDYFPSLKILFARSTLTQKSPLFKKSKLILVFSKRGYMFDFVFLDDYCSPVSNRAWEKPNEMGILGPMKLLKGLETFIESLFTTTYPHHRLRGPTVQLSM